MEDRARVIAIVVGMWLWLVPGWAAAGESRGLAAAAATESAPTPVVEAAQTRSPRVANPESRLPLGFKVCRVNDLHTARYLARCGVDFLGLHAIWDVPEPSRLRAFVAIIAEMRRCYPWVRTVLVTRLEDMDKLLAVYRAMPCDFVQISAPIGRGAKHGFLVQARRVFPPVELFNVISAIESEPGAAARGVIGHYVLIDKAFRGGLHQRVDTSAAGRILARLSDKYVLAVGLGDSALRFDGMDVMGSLEFGRGDKRKDIRKVNKRLKNTYGWSRIAWLGFPATSG